MASMSTLAGQGQSLGAAPPGISKGLSRTALVTRRRGEQGVRSWDTEVALNLPEVVTREEWLVARKQLLSREKELTRQRDQVPKLS